MVTVGSKECRLAQVISIEHSLSDSLRIDSILSVIPAVRVYIPEKNEDIFCDSLTCSFIRCRYKSSRCDATVNIFIRICDICKLQEIIFELFGRDTRINTVYKLSFNLFPMSVESLLSYSSRRCRRINLCTAVRLGKPADEFCIISSFGVYRLHTSADCMHSSLLYFKSINRWR